MELIGAVPGVRFVNEPFEPEFVAEKGLPTYLESLSVRERKVLGIPESENGKKLFCRHLMDYGKTRIKGPYFPFSPQFHVISNRRVLKVVHATAIVEWIIHQELNFQPILLIRHPIATALSLLKSSNALRSKANLLHTGFREDYLDDRLINLAESILKRGDQMECFVLEWCLDNLPIQRAHERNPEWLLISYEEMNLNPVASIELIADKFDLDTGKLMKVMGNPSASTTRDRREALQADKSRKISRWRTVVDKQTEKRLFSIIKEFGIEFYSEGSLLPQRALLNFTIMENELDPDKIANQKHA